MTQTTPAPEWFPKFTNEREAELRRIAESFEPDVGELNWPMLMRELLKQIDVLRARA